MLRGKALLFPSACLQGFCSWGADALLGHCHWLICWGWFVSCRLGGLLISSNKAGRTVLSGELCCSCTQVELIPSFGILWVRGEGWSVPWQHYGANLLQCHEDVHMQSIEFSTCKQQF